MGERTAWIAGEAYLIIGEEARWAWGHSKCCANDHREKPVFEGPFCRPGSLKQGMNYRASVVRREKCFRIAEKFLAILARKKSCPFALQYYNFPVLSPSKLL